MKRILETGGKKIEKRERSREISKEERSRRYTSDIVFMKCVNAFYLLVVICCTGLPDFLLPSRLGFTLMNSSSSAYYYCPCSVFVPVVFFFARCRA